MMMFSTQKKSRVGGRDLDSPDSPDSPSTTQSTARWLSPFSRSRYPPIEEFFMPLSRFPRADALGNLPPRPFWIRAPLNVGYGSTTFWLEPSTSFRASATVTPLDPALPPGSSRQPSRRAILASLEG